MKSRIVTVLMVLLFSITMVSCAKSIDEATADKVLSEALSMGQAKGKSCLMSFASEDIMEEAGKKHGVSKGSIVKYIKSDSGKKHLGKKMLSCMKAKKK